MLINDRYSGAPVLYDSDGHALRGFYQWDVNQKIAIKGLPDGCTLECHFAKEGCAASYAVEPVTSASGITVDVPNEVLKTPNNVFLYLYVDTSGDGQKTKYEYEIELTYRAKPENYEPSPQERITMRSMMLRAEGYAAGTHDGVPVGEDDPAYENNAKYYAERAIIDTEVLIEEHNQDPEAHEELFAGKEDKKPYASLRRRSEYLYEVSFIDIPEYEETGFAPAMCSSVVYGGRLYRNLDWSYDDTASFHIIGPDFEGTSFIKGLTNNEINNQLVGQLPYHMVDGVNKYGIMMSTHVLYNDFDYHGDGDIPLTMLPYLALKNVKSMESIQDDLGDILENLAVTPGLEEMEYLIQVLLSDGETTYVLRPGDDGVYEAVDISSNPKLTNFRWVEDTEVDREDLQLRPTGVERWNNMTPDMKELRFTAAYETPDRLSEFIGINGTDKYSSDEELTDIYNLAHTEYLNRNRDGKTWQTMHSAVYSSKSLEHLWVQENWTKDYIASAGGEAESEIVFIEYEGATFDEVKALIDAGKTVKTGIRDSDNVIEIPFISCIDGEILFVTSGEIGIMVVKLSSIDGWTSYTAPFLDDEIIYLTYGESTYEEALAAYNAGKTLKVRYSPEEGDNVDLPLVEYDGNFIFGLTLGTFVYGTFFSETGWGDFKVDNTDAGNIAYNSDPEEQEYEDGTVGAALQSKADLINGKVPASQLPDDAPSDGKQYARQDGEWTEVTGGGGSPSWSSVRNKPFESLGTTMKVKNGVLDVYISETANPAGGNTLSIG